MSRWPFIALLLLAACGDQQTRMADDALRSGNSAYHQGRFQEAAGTYREASFDPRALHNAGKASYRAGDPGQAVNDLSGTVAMFSDPQELAHAYHDLGNARLIHSRWADSMSMVIDENIGAIRMEGDDIVGKVKLAVVRDSLRKERSRMEQLTDSALSQGVLAYKLALRNDPADEDTRYNLAVAKRLLASREKERKENGKDPKEQDVLSENARALIEQADELVASFRFKEALELLERGLQEDPTLAREKQYIDKLGVVTRAAEAS